MSIGTVGREQQTPRILYPHTGEIVDLDDYDDLALGMLLDEAYEMERQWRTVQRAIRSEIERRARERGYNDGKRRVYAQRERTQRVVWEQVEQGVQG